MAVLHRVLEGYLIQKRNKVIDADIQVPLLVVMDIV